MSTEVKNLIFDFGGILINLDYEKSYRQLRSLLRLEGDSFSPEYQLILDEYEMGYFGEASFIHRLQRTVEHIVTERSIIDAWNAMLLDIPVERLHYVKSLREHYNVYLLSNTNHTHLTYVRRAVLSPMGITNFEKDHFIKAYYSHEIKYRKPNHDIYEYVIKDAGINPSESLFIDDNIDNVKGAQEVGLLAVRHDPNQDIIQCLPNYLTNV